MSAIFGIMHTDGRAADIHELQRMNLRLAAHGPDREGLWTGGHMGLGHRLMSFTPEDLLERQPIVGVHEHCVLVADGRLDDRPELIRQLGLSAAEANEMPDSAFILKSYEKWDSACCSRLVGDFVFAVFDSRRSEILIARSPMGKRSLYYHVTPRMFAFASAPKGLFALPGIDREIDRRSLADYLVWAPREPGATLYARVSELQPGQSVVVRRQGIQLRQFWTPNLSEISFARDSEYVEAFNVLFDRVISDHLRSASPVGVMLSGGLDSSSVGVTAAALLATQEKRLAAFTEVPPAGFDRHLNNNRYADETPLVRAIAGQCENLDLNFVRTGGSFLLDGIEPFFESLEGPFRAAWNRLWWEAILRQASGQNVRVLLTGLPGNLTISRSGEGFIPRLIREGRWLQAVREARLSGRYNGVSTLRIFGGIGATSLPAGIWLAASRLWHPRNPTFRSRHPWHAYSAIHPDFARDQQVEERARQKSHDFHARPKNETRAERYETLRRWDSGLQVGRGYEALCGVQTRNPTGDVRIVEFCMSLPDEQFLRNGVPRSLIRRAMADRLPPEVLTNRRRGLQAADWFDQANTNRARMAEALECFEYCELASTALDLRRLRGILQQMPEAGSGKKPPSAHHRALLGTAFMTGSFLRWFESAEMHGRKS